ncbi:hypothetical protein NPIL_148911 [Nephila pilipes]|uniref:Uncharacterized protein n=1 Tax=Nephila pilipes TaxID=299642 RepID=A0A8X6U958_NEPPI|nr:hypothetical protein NPIL_148911 [Nephila pilipes]
MCRKKFRTQRKLEEYLDSDFGINDEDLDGIIDIVELLPVKEDDVSNLEDMYDKLIGIFDHVWKDNNSVMMLSKHLEV